MDHSRSKSLVCRFLAVSSIVFGLLFTTNAVAEIDAFMKIDGVPGEATNQGHENEILLTGYTQNFGTADCSRVVAMKLIDRASPALISLAAAGRLVPQVVISLRKGGDASFLGDFFVATLDQVIIDTIQLAEQNDRLLEKVVLAPRIITISYRPQKADGSFDAAITTTVTCQRSTQR